MNIAYTKTYLLAIMIISTKVNADAQTKIRPDNFLQKIFSANPTHFDSIVAQKDTLKVQVIYTQIDRKKNNKPVFTDHFYHVDPQDYYYPASTVKLPVAILALQKLNELNIPGLDKNTTMITGAQGYGQTEVENDPTAPDGRPTIAHYIKKILLVSDNDAFNRLYEFLGQEYINNNLHKMGYTDIQIIHRLAITLTEEQNRQSNPVRFIDSSGKVIYEKPATKSAFVYSIQDTRIGKGFMRNGKLVNEPFDFSLKNRMSLQSLHLILRSVIFPEAMPKKRRFGLTKDDYAFLRLYMSMQPGESRFPSYDTGEYWNNYVKMILFGVDKKDPDPSIRIFSKSGWSYGFLTDAVYIADFKNNIEFMVTATVYCNADGILNDDKYDYSKLGYPFMKHLGEALHAYELQRKRKHKPDLAAMRFSYAE